MLVERQDAPHIVLRPVDQRGNALHRRIPLVGRLQMPHGAQNDIDFLDDMHRQANGPRLVHDAALDVLAYPPRGIGREAETALRIELFEGMDQPEITFLDQIEQGNAPVQVMLGNVHDQAQVVLDHALAGGKIALAHQARGRQLLLRRQQRLGADFSQVELGDVFEQFDFRGDDFRLRRQQGLLGLPLELLIYVVAARVHRFGKYPAGSTGLPCLRISKCSLTVSESVLPISAIFCPRLTCCPSLTRILRLWA